MVTFGYMAMEVGLHITSRVMITNQHYVYICVFPSSFSPPLPLSNIDGEGEAPDSGMRQSALWMWQNTTRVWHWISGCSSIPNIVSFPETRNTYSSVNNPGHRVSPTLVIDDAHSLYLFGGEFFCH